MLPPLHLHGSVSTFADAGTAHRRLVTDLDERIRTATATALASTGPQVVASGLSPSALPTVTAASTDADAPGTVEVSWRGDEETTGWPALTARLALVPRPGGHARLRLLAHRAPSGGLATSRLGLLQRQRLVRVTLRAFLEDLADQLGGSAVDVGGGRGADAQPLFVHHVQHVALDPHDARDRLLTDLVDRAARATEVALDRSRPTLAAGRFRQVARPDVAVRVASADEPATVWISWDDHEEATGWPRATFGLLLEAQGDGSRLSVLAAREPAYDLSRNRIDKLERHRILERAGADLAAAIVDQLGSGDVTPADGHLLVAARG